MPTFLLLLLVTLRSIVRPRVDLQLENLTLRHQIGVLQRSVQEAPEINLGRSSLLGFSVPPLARLELDVSPRQTRKQSWLGIVGVSLVLDLEGSTGTAWTPPRQP